MYKSIRIGLNNGIAPSGHRFIIEAKIDFYISVVLTLPYWSNMITNTCI